MDVIRRVKELQARSEEWRRAELTVGLVPTMGYLHEGHLSLVDIACGQADRVVVSIFVNPKQFGPTEDLARYPRDEEGDLAKLSALGVDVAFVPDLEEIYPRGYETYVDCTRLPSYLCGARREGHFKGVLTVVAKLFLACTPHLAVFGEKDYQQFLVIKRMARDLNLPVEVLSGPTVREEDGLAMSSRNSYLEPDARPAANALFKALNRARQLVTSGVVDAIMLRRAMTELVEQAGGRVDYVAIVDPQTLEELQTIDQEAHAAVAVFFGKTRLIDNMRLKG